MVSVRARRLPPYQRLADGLLLPVPIGGHPALDFCNTCAGRHGSGAREYLVSYEHLAVFAREVGLVDASACARIRSLARRSGEEAGAVLAASLELREALFRVCRSEGRRSDRELLSDRAQEAARAAEFQLDAGRGPAARWALPTTLELPLLTFARSAAGLLVTDDAAAIRTCPGRDCGWLFVDATGRRRWCSMAACGNREKVRRHAARVRAGRR
jgi:predicted RNA-binding Zn ribbon-like protein